MTKMRVLNWYSQDKRMTRGLKKAFQERREFVTLRLGNKWANKLNPGQKLAISISNHPRKPLIIGYACVVDVSKKCLIDVSSRDLSKNIGAKNLVQALSDMRKVYKPEIVDVSSVASIIRLLPLKKILR